MTSLYFECGVGNFDTSIGTMTGSKYQPTWPLYICLLANHRCWLPPINALRRLYDIGIFVVFEKPAQVIKSEFGLPMHTSFVSTIVDQHQHTSNTMDKSCSIPKSLSFVSEISHFWWNPPIWHGLPWESLVPHSPPGGKPNRCRWPGVDCGWFPCRLSKIVEKVQLGSA